MRHNSNLICDIFYPEMFILSRLADVCFYRNGFTHQNRTIRVMDTPSWLSGEIIFVLAFLIVVGVSAMAVHRYRETRGVARTRGGNVAAAKKTSRGRSEG